MRIYSIFPAGEKWRLHIPEGDVVECASFHQAALLADTYRAGANLWWWTDWCARKPQGGRLRYQRNAVVRPHVN